MPPIHSVTCGDNANFTDKFNAYEWTWTLDAPTSMDVFHLGESTATPNTKEGKSEGVKSFVAWKSSQNFHFLILLT